MKISSVVFRGLILLLMFATCVRADNEITQIKLQHPQCYRSCPVDELTLNADGSALFSGGENSARQGLHRGQIAPEQFAILARALKEENFFELRPQIGNGMTHHYIDVIISASSKNSLLGRPYTVVFRDGGNYALLQKLQAAFAIACARIRWQKDEISSKSGVRGKLKRDLTAYETKLFADKFPKYTSIPLSYAVVELISMDDRKIVYFTRSDRMGRFEFFAPPGKYLLSIDDMNAAYSLDDLAYLPRWLSDGIRITVNPEQFVSIEKQLSDFNTETNSRVAPTLQNAKKEAVADK